MGTLLLLAAGARQPDAVGQPHGTRKEGGSLALARCTIQVQRCCPHSLFRCWQMHMPLRFHVLFAHANYFITAPAFVHLFWFWIGLQ